MACFWQRVDVSLCGVIHINLRNKPIVPDLDNASEGNKEKRGVLVNTKALFLAIILPNQFHMLCLFEKLKAFSVTLSRIAA
jgi:hypothetical protein